VYGASLVINLALAFWLAPRYGMEGAAIANAVTFALSKWVRLVLVRRFVGIQPYDRGYLRLVGPALVSLAAMWFTHRAVVGGWTVDVAATASAGVVAYGVAYLLMGLTAGERRQVRGLVGRMRAR
jgi:O-antigen/teichoic acid export membrane protein